MTISKPLLPNAYDILPYLKRIDASRIYCNGGPLNDEYEERLSQLFESPCVTGSSATSLLTATLLALDLPKGSFIACPSWTFVATPASIVAAGHVPYFVDVGKDGIALTKVSDVAAMIYVAPCGAPFDTKTIDKFSITSGIPVIIDAAAGFDSFSALVKPGKSPVVISTHATKVFGTGEGGFATCLDRPLLKKIKQITNFGLNEDRKAMLPGINAKLSEYHAAVGLAELDGWEEKRHAYLKKTKIYGLNYATSLVPIKGSDGRRNVYGCHHYPAYKDYPRTELPMTEKMMREMSFVTVAL